MTSDARDYIRRKLQRVLLPNPGRYLMNKADIVERLAEKKGWTRAQTMALVDTVFMIIKDTLADGEELKVSGFGVFSVKEKNDRKGRNPQTGEDITINARKILRFRASLLLKKAVNGLPA